jgi:hypothetical protein
MTLQLTRRVFGGLACSAAVGLALPGGSTVAAIPPAPKSIVDLADLWRLAVEDLLFVTRNKAGATRNLAARHKAVFASVQLMDTPARTPRDVLIKYYVFYESTKFSSFELDYPELRLDAWCKEIEEEADAFDLAITPFWGRRWIDQKCTKDISTTDWSVVYPWRINHSIGRR